MGQYPSYYINPIISAHCYTRFYTEVNISPCVIFEAKGVEQQYFEKWLTI